jgi:hypothetical protein
MGGIQGRGELIVAIDGGTEPGTLWLPCAGLCLGGVSAHRVVCIRNAPVTGRIVMTFDSTRGWCRGQAYG